MKRKKPATEAPEKAKRRRPTTGFNPPYSQSVSTNIARKTLTTMDAFIPIGHPLRKCINRTTGKVSYRTMPNMAKVVMQKFNKNPNQKSKIGHATATKILYVL